MPAYYYSIVCLGLCTFYSQIAYRSYNGKSNIIHFLLDIGSKIGFVSFLGILIMCTLGDAGASTLLLFIATAILAALTHFIGRIPAVGVGSLVGIVVFSVLVWMSVL